MNDVRKKTICLIMSLAVFLAGGCSYVNKNNEEKKTLLSPEHPVTIEVWHYYNGAQQDAMNALVAEFNDGYGSEHGIKVKASGLGNVSDLEENVIASIDGKVGAKEVPNIFAAYADTAYAVDRKGMAVDLRDYMTDNEIAEYMDSYIDEGKFSSEDSLKIFPVAKATEVFILNKTDWDKFSQESGCSLEDLSTMEGITKTSQIYYRWTDSLTDTPNDGKAFFGRDAMANYFILGARQMGVEVFSVKDGVPVLNFDKKIIRRLWDNYYVPYVNGYFTASGKFRSDDIKTGNILSFVGSSAGATFFPDQVTLNDNYTYDIQMQAFETPQFENGERFAVQQGAGMVVTKTEDKAEIEASIEFLKWFTDTEQNIRFAVSSGYLPVKKSANNKEMIENSVQDINKNVLNVLDVSLQQVHDSTLYTTRAFENGTSARNILEHSLSDKAVQDRAEVVSSIQAGTSREDAVSQYVTDENFNNWYESTKSSLEALIDTK
ncbi:MAG: extracellular solute-binding protein [Muricomes sp.]